MIRESCDNGDDGKHGESGFRHADTSYTSRHGFRCVPRLTVSVVAPDPGECADKNPLRPGRDNRTMPVPGVRNHAPSRTGLDVRSFSAGSVPDAESPIPAPPVPDPGVDPGKRTEGLYHRASLAKLADSRGSVQSFSPAPHLTGGSFSSGSVSPDHENARAPVPATPDPVAPPSAPVSHGTSVPGTGRPVPRLVPGWDDDELDPEEYGPIVFKDGVFRIEDEPEGGEIRVDPALKALIDSILL